MQPEQWVEVIEEYVGTRTQRERGVLLEFAKSEDNMALLEKYVRLAQLRERQQVQQVLAEIKHETAETEPVVKPAAKPRKKVS